MRCCITLLLWCFALATLRAAETRPAEMLAQRQRSLVTITYVMENEMNRQEVTAVGVVIDEEGRVVTATGAVPGWLPVDRITEIKAFPVDDAGDGYEAHYLGQSPRSSLQFFQIDAPELREQLTPVTHWRVGEVGLGEEVWGIGVTQEDLDYLPYWLGARLSSDIYLPRPHGVATDVVATPGSLVFNSTGEWVGWSLEGFPEEYDLQIEGRGYRAQLRPTDESNFFLLASSLLEELQDVPTAPDARPWTWMGVTGLQPLDKETSRFLGLEDQGAVIVSEVLDGQPADQAGLQARDIITGIDGEPIPYFRAEFAMVEYVNMAIDHRSPGDALPLDIIRGDEAREITITLGEGPKMVRQAERTYFPKLGLTVREMVFDDAIARRVDWDDAQGAVVSFVRPNSNPDTAGLKPGDWIIEVNGEEITDYEPAVAALEQVRDSDESGEYVLLVQRGNETSLIRVPRTAQ
ncbi:MAG: PDZ/DHR/GLGF domain-containing protein [Puniceicoccaceae bacterium 5H]|nr:MAG: PDZ/DHR/GLGF domain-containing protein [Puniceicoccaceae bacterium 5H]